MVELRFVDPLFLDELDDNDGVGSWTVLIHQGRGQGPVFVTLLHPAFDIGIAHHLILGKAFNIDT